MNSPFLEISLGNPLTLIICLGLQTILGLHTHVILVFLILNILKAFFFKTIPAPFANLPFLELSLSDHLAPIIFFGLQSIHGLQTHAIIGGSQTWYCQSTFNALSS
jgi:hypothetical protein